MSQDHSVTRRARAIGGLLGALAVLLAGAAVAGAATVSNPGNATAAETAPTRIAYVTGSASSPTTQVWLASAIGGEAKRLGPGSQPLLAPNGQSVAVSLLGATADSEHGPALGIYSALGTPVANYLDLETASAEPLAWSPDSRYVAVARRSTVIPFLAAGSGLVVIDTQTGEVTSIAEGVVSGASFAPDGSDRLVFALSHSLSPSAPSRLFLTAPHGGGSTRLGSDAHALNPIWGARGIAYDHVRSRGRDEAPAYQIWLQPADGGRARRLTSLKVPPLLSGLVPLSFSAAGTRLLAEYEGEDTSEAWALTVSNGRARRVTVRGHSVLGAGISRDGGSLLVDENGLFGPASSSRVALVPFGGGRSKVLVAHGAQASWNG